MVRIHKFKPRKGTTSTPVTVIGEYPTRDKLTSPKTEWHNGAAVKELLARADEPGSTAGEAVFCFFIVQYLIL